MKNKIILASKSAVRKKILNDNNIDCEVIPANIDEDEVKKTLIENGTSPISISKNLAELKSIKISKKKPEELVLGADSVIDLNGEIISGEVFSFNKASFICSSSTPDGIIIELIPFLSKIFFLTPLFDARIIVFVI